MQKSSKMLRSTMLTMMVAMGVVISPLLRVEGLCPMAHFINVVCAVFLGPWYALASAVMIGVIRMLFMAIPPLALTGAIFGAFLSGVFYKLSKGSLLAAVLGEIVGTGFIGSIVSYPVMTFLWGRHELTWFFYVPSFVLATIIGGSIALVFLKALSKSWVLTKIQYKLGGPVYDLGKHTMGD